MSTGKIQFAEQNGSFVLKFVGEVRLTLCSALDSTIEKIFAALNFSAIIIDLTETQSIDSTTLGLLAKLSILSRQKIGLLPTLVTTNPGHYPSVAVDGLRSGVQYRRSSDSVPGMPVRPAAAGPSRKMWCATRFWRRTAS
ncbi:anti-anti-sigma factor [Pseudomonas aeruginosa]|nr:anti-anti-sigma factor [Pseudomonas aeruginosa]